MNKALITIALGSAALLSGCKPEIERVEKIVPVLRASSIYNADSVYFYREKFGEAHKEIAASYMEKAKTEAANPSRALYHVKRAITLCPSLEYYRELLNCLDATANYKELREACSFLIHPAYIRLPNGQSAGSAPPFGTMDPTVYYEYFVSGIIAYNGFSGEEVYEARELKMDLEAIKEKLIADTRIKMDRSSPEFSNILLQFLEYDELAAFSKKEGAFKAFLQSIKDSSNTFLIDKDAVHRFDYSQNQYEEGMGIRMRDLYIYYLQEKRDNKDKWYNFNFTHRMKISDSVNAIVYAIDTSELACPLEMRHVYHRLVTFGHSGEIVDSKVIAWQAGEEIAIAEYTNGTIGIMEYSRAWKKPYNKKDFDNFIVATEATVSSEYKVERDGKITTVKAAPSPHDP